MPAEGVGQLLNHLPGEGLQDQPGHHIPFLAELSHISSETDLHIAKLTLNLFTSNSVRHMQAILTIQKTVLPGVLKLAESQ